LIEKLDSFLGFPSEDPHGDPIPNQYGEVQKPNNKLLAEAEIDKRYVCVGVKDSSSAFLQYLDKHKIGLGTIMKVVATEPFDNTFELLIDNKSITVSSKIATNIFIS
jgi:DtxR family Mn-dependent transcriptional regulator